MSPSPVPARSFPSVVIAELSLNFSVFINQYRQTVAILQLVPGPISLSWRNARVVTPLLHTEMSVPPYTGCLYYTVSPSLLPCALSFCPDSGLLLPGWVPPVNVYCWCLFFFPPTLFELSQLMPGALFSQLFSQQNVSLYAVCPQVLSQCVFRGICRKSLWWLSLFF